MDDRTVIDPGFSQPGYPQPGGGDATMVVGSPMAPPMAPGGMGYEATQQAITAVCPVCQTPNPPSERYCQDCGLLMGSAPAEVEPLPDASQLPRLFDATGGREFLLNPGVNAVGRESGEVLLGDPTVSRRHAQLTLENGTLIVEDLGSSNGTKVAGQQVRVGDRVTAYDGDTVKFGQVSLTVALPGGPARSGEAAPAGAAAPAAPEVAPVEDRGPAVASLVLADGTEYPLFEGVNSVGRRSGNHVAIADAFMSGKHGEILCSPDGTGQFVDVGSTNGSFYGAEQGGERIPANVPVPLADGTTFRLGKTEVTFRSAAGAAPAPESADEPVAASAEPAAPAGQDLLAEFDTEML